AARESVVHELAGVEVALHVRAPLLVITPRLALLRGLFADSLIAILDGTRFLGSVGAGVGGVLVLGHGRRLYHRVPAWRRRDIRGHFGAHGASAVFQGSGGGGGSSSASGTKAMAWTETPVLA